MDGLHLQRGNWGLRSCLEFLCGVAVNKIPHRGIVVTSNSTVCDAWVSSCSDAIHCSFTFFCIAAFRSPPRPNVPLFRRLLFFKKKILNLWRDARLKRFEVNAPHEPKKSDRNYSIKEQIKKEGEIKYRAHN